MFACPNACINVFVAGLIQVLLGEHSLNIVLTNAETFDVEGTACGLIYLNDGTTQTRVAGRDIKVVVNKGQSRRKNSIDAPS